MTVIGTEVTPPIAAVPLDPIVTEIIPPPVDTTAPWTADLAEAFPDETVRASVDAYLRTKQQPRMTQLEQQLAERKPAHELYDDLLAGPQETLTALVTELFDEDLATKFGELFAPAATVVTPPPVVDDEIPFEKLPKSVQAAVRAEEARAAEAAAADDAALYHSTVDNFITGHADLTAEDKQFFHPFIAAAGGDLNTATTNYVARRTALAAHANPTVALTPEQQAAADAAVLAALPPATLGTGAAVATGAPPAKPAKENIDQALSGWFADNRAAKNAPTTVGTV